MGNKELDKKSKMVVLSVLRSTQGGCKMFRAPLTGFLRNVEGKQTLQQVIVRNMGGGARKMTKYPTRYEWNVFKDQWNFYLLLGIIPLALFTTCVNVMYGRAELQEIPEGYEPKHWEYHCHPVTQIMAKYFYWGPVAKHEVYLHNLKFEQDRAKMNKLEEKVRLLMSKNADYKAWYWMPANENKVWRSYEYFHKDYEGKKRDIEQRQTRSFRKFCQSLADMWIIDCLIRKN